MLETSIIAAITLLIFSKTIIKKTRKAWNNWRFDRSTKKRFERILENLEK